MADFSHNQMLIFGAKIQIPLQVLQVQTFLRDFDEDGKKVLKINSMEYIENQSCISVKKSIF